MVKVSKTFKFGINKYIISKSDRYEYYYLLKIENKIKYIYNFSTERWISIEDIQMLGNLISKSNLIVLVKEMFNEEINF